MYMVCECGRGGKGHTDGEKLFTDLRVKLFMRKIYSVNLRPDAWSQYGSRYHRGLVS